MSESSSIVSVTRSAVAPQPGSKPSLRRAQARPLRVVVHLARAHQPHRVAQRAPQRGYVLDPAVQEQRLAPGRVQPQELQQPALSFLFVAPSEHAAGQIAVEILHAAPDRPRLARAWESPSRRARGPPPPCSARSAPYPRSTLSLMARYSETLTSRHCISSVWIWTYSQSATPRRIATLITGAETTASCTRRKIPASVRSVTTTSLGRLLPRLDDLPNLVPLEEALADRRQAPQQQVRRLPVGGEDPVDLVDLTDPRGPSGVDRAHPPS